MLIASLKVLLVSVICKGIVSVGAENDTQAMSLSLREVEQGGFSRKNSSSDSPKILFYSEWSPWSRCTTGRCEITRRRRCLHPQKCGNIVLKETNLCPVQGDRRNRRKCQRAQNRRKHRHKTDDFHVIRLATPARVQSPPPKSTPSGGANFSRRPPVQSRRASQRHVTTPSLSQPPYWHNGNGQWAMPIAHNRYYQTTTNYPLIYPSGYPGWSNYLQTPTHQRESSVIFPSSGLSSNGVRPSGDRLTTYESKLYGKWSRWSQCTRSCTTHRRRNCKRKDLCGNTMLKESAYCYIEDSYCQRWIQRKVQQKGEENEAIQDYKYPEQDIVAGKGNGHGGASPSSSSPSLPRQPLQPNLEQQLAGNAYDDCGVAGNATKSLGNMLRIIGGRPTAKGRWPWQVAVLNRYKEAFCGGTLVSSRWVLTAAHCVRKRLYVRIGEHDLSERDGTETELRIEQTIRHPSYDEETVDNDVALLRLPVAVVPGRYRGVACLPTPRQTLLTHRYCTIIGWGKRVSSDTFGTDVLHEAEVPIVSNEVCRHVYEDYHITSNMFCAGYRRGRMDSCAGDSGGPLLCKEGDRWTVFGITSFGEGCGKHGKYGIYTRLPNYVKWIQKIIQD